MIQSYIFCIFCMLIPWEEKFTMPICILQQSLYNIFQNHIEKRGENQPYLPPFVCFVQGTDLRWVKNDGVFTQPESRYYSENTQQCTVLIRVRYLSRF
jgi:hypothetical protein